MCGQSNSSIIAAAIILYVNIKLRNGIENIKEIALDLFTVINIFFYTGGNRSTSSSMSLTSGLMFYDDFGIHSGLFVFLKICFAWYFSLIYISFYLKERLFNVSIEKSKI